ncbi:hypothetical protein ACFVP3_23810 [Streptomyces sp. NPDC057806]|uniref:hypothetical protein n=1 Tax=Streptomyces sp. NPDC057806 TaxID=3346255 RepID=UPI0036803437
MYDDEEADGQEICGAATQLPAKFIELERRVTGLDWNGVAVTCISEPHGGVDHAGLLILDGEQHGTYVWSAEPL